METDMSEHHNREAVGVFHDENALRSAADELMVSGFDRAYLSLVAGHATIEKKFGHMYDNVSEVEDDVAMPRHSYAASDSRHEAEAATIGGLAYIGAIGGAGAIVATGGTIAAALLVAAAAGGAGGLIGAALAQFMECHHADYMQEQLDRGGLLLWVRTVDEEHERRAGEILKRWSADDVHVHDLPDIKYQLKGGVSRDMSFMNLLGL